MIWHWLLSIVVPLVIGAVLVGVATLVGLWIERD